MRLISLIIISSLISNIALGGCPNAVTLHVGDTVKDCDRVGLSTARANEVEKTIKQGEINLQIIQTQNDLIKMKDDKAAEAMKAASLYKDDDQRERGEVDRLRSEGTTKILIGIGLGFLGAWVAAEAARALRSK